MGSAGGGLEDRGVSLGSLFVRTDDTKDFRSDGYQVSPGRVSRDRSAVDTRARPESDTARLLKLKKQRTEKSFLCIKN